MATLEKLVPYCKLYQTRFGADGKAGRVQIGNTLTPLTDTGYGTTDVMGISSVEIEYGTGFITCEVEFPIHQSMMIAAKDNQNSAVHNIFMLSNRWEIEFGWGGSMAGGQNGAKITNMVMADWDLDYDSETRTFTAKLTLIPANYYILSDIKILMLPAIEELRNIYRSKDSFKGSATDGNKYSLGYIITTILDSCKALMDNYIKSGNVAIDRGQGTEGDMTVELAREFVASKGSRSDHVAAENEQKISTTAGRPYQYMDMSQAARDTRAQGASQMSSVWLANKTKTFLSDLFKYATTNDIPNPDSIRLMLFGEDQGVLDNVARAFNSEPMSNDSMMNKITDDSNKDLNVLQFIMGLLDDNGFAFTPLPTSRTADGQVQWVIMQSEFNNISLSISETEYIGIRSVEKPRDGETSPKFSTIWGSKAGTENSQLFDLHSSRNIVLSVDAKTETGNSTIGAGYAAEAMITQESNEPAGTVMEEHMNRMYDLMAKQSKELNLEILGFPDLKVLDNIVVNLAGDLYSGRYKVIEMGHSIGSKGFFSNVRAIRTVHGLNGDSGKDDNEGKAEVVPKAESNYEKTKQEALSQISSDPKMGAVTKAMAQDRLLGGRPGRGGF